MNKFTFEEQAKYFAKKLNLKTDSYLDVMGEQHDYFFMVAGANRNEVLLSLREAVDSAIHNGTTLAQFRQDFDRIIDKTGWQYQGGRNWRTRIIYDTNVYGAYNRGRLQQHLDLADVLPYWEYQHNPNAHPREEHMDWDGLVLRADDPWWRYHYPVKAYGCHCTVIAHDEEDLKALGKSVQTAPDIEFEDKLVGVRTGMPRTVRVAKGTDVGFAPYDFTQLNKPNTENIDQLLMQRMVNAAPKFASTAVMNVLANTGATQLLTQCFANTVETIATEKMARGQFHYVGVIPEPVLQKLDELDLPPQSAVIGMQGQDILHALRDVKAERGIGLSVDFWKRLPTLLQQPTAVLLENTQKHPTLLYVYQTEQGKVAIKMDYEVKLRNPQTGKKENTVINLVRTGSAITTQEQVDTLKGMYQILWGSLD